MGRNISMKIREFPDPILCNNSVREDDTQHHRKGEK